MTTHTITLIKTNEKKHSVIFHPETLQRDNIVTSVYIMRPMVDGHTKAKLTIEFLD